MKALHSVLATTLLCAWLPAAVARADKPSAADERTQRAKAHYELGQAHYKLGEYEQAMRDFEAGYQCRPLPQFLYNIAQVARLSGRPQKALDYFKRYLAVAPSPRERQEAEGWIASIERA